MTNELFTISTAEYNPERDRLERMKEAAPDMYELICDMLPEERAVYEYTLENDTPDEAEPYKMTIDRAEELLAWIDLPTDRQGGKDNGND